MNLHRAIEANVLHVRPGLTILRIAGQNRQIRAVGRPRFIVAIERLPHFAAKMSLPIARRPREDDRHRIGCRPIEAIDDLILARVLKFNRLNSLPPGRPLDRLVIHIVITRHWPVMAKKVKPSH